MGLNLDKCHVNLLLLSILKRGSAAIRWHWRRPSPSHATPPRRASRGSHWGVDLWVGMPLAIVDHVCCKKGSLRVILSTTLQSMVNTKLSQQIFWPWIDRRIKTIPHNLCAFPVGFPLQFTLDYNKHYGSSKILVNDLKESIFISNDVRLIIFQNPQVSWSQ